MSRPKILPPARLAEIRALAESVAPGKFRECSQAAPDGGLSLEPALALMQRFITEGREAIHALLDHIDALQALAELGQIVLDTTEHSGACHLCGRPNDSDTPHDECPVGIYLKEYGG